MEKIFKSLSSLILLSFLLFTPQLHAQTIHCGTDDMTAAMEATYPDFGRQNGSFISNASDMIRVSAATGCEENYVIPVVFHVFVSGGANSVPMSQIQSALDKANEDFNLQNADANAVFPAFDPIKKGFNIEFTLAQLDPNGSPTTGVNYYPATSGFGGISMNNTVASYAWDNYKYLNIYIMRDLYGDGILNNSGVAWLPDTWMSNNGIARIVYNDRYLGNTGTSIADPEFQSVFTHECGHYLGLHHTFRNGCSAPGDEVDDTPPTAGSAGCWNATSCGNLTNGENYMDYNVTCYKMFTAGQVERMKDALNHPARKPLWQKANLQATGTWNQYQYANSAPVAGFTVSDTVVYVGDNVVFVDESCGFPTSRSWTFAGGFPGTSSNFTENVSYANPGTYPATLVVSNSNGTSSPTTVNITVLPQPICQVSRDFENTALNQLPTGWTHNGQSGVSFVVEDNVTVTTTTGTANVGSHGGSKAIYGNENWAGSGPIPLRLVTSSIDLAGLTNPQLSYWDLRGWDDAWPVPKPEHVVEVQISSSPSGPWTTLATDTTLQSEALTWRRVGDLDLSSYAGQVVYLSFYTDTHHYYWRIDDICVGSDPSTNLEGALEEGPVYALEQQVLHVFGEHYSLFDLQGRRLAQGIGEESLDVSSMSAGIYALVVHRQGKIVSRKIYLGGR